MDKLSDRVEALAGPDREMDRLIMAAIGTHVLESRGKDKKRWWYPIVERPCIRYSNEDGYGYAPPFPSFTRSLDSAMTLIPEGWTWNVDATGWTWGDDATVSKLSIDWTLWAPEPTVTHKKVMGKHTMPAIALTAAALKARGL
jgi:hypothetical protein